MHMISAFIPLFELNAKISKHPVSKGVLGTKNQNIHFLSIPATFWSFADRCDRDSSYFYYLFIYLWIWVALKYLSISVSKVKAPVATSWLFWFQARRSSSHLTAVLSCHFLWTRVSFWFDKAKFLTSAVAYYLKTSRMPDKECHLVNS